MAKVECVMQDGPKDCGVCCLLMLMKLYGGNASKEYLRELTHTTKEGVTAYHLLEGAKKLGFDGRGLKAEILQLDEYMLPCIAHVIINDAHPHFVVLYQINFQRKVVVLLDPARGKIKMSFSNFERLSTGYFLYLKPKRKLPSLEKTNFLRRVVFILIRKYRKILLFIFILSFIYTILNMFIAFHLQFLMEYVFPFALKENAKMISILMIFLILFQLLSYFFHQCLLQYFEKKISQSLMDCILQQMITLPYPYYKNRTTGEMISRLTDLEEVKKFLSRLFGSILLDFLCALVMIVASCFLNMTLTFFMIGMTIISILILFFFQPFQKKMIQEIYEKNAMVNTLLIETIQGVETVKGMHLEHFLIDKISHWYYCLLMKIEKFHFLLHLGQFFKEHVLKIGFVLLLWKGSCLIMEQKMTVMQLITFQHLYYYFLQAIQNMFSYYLEYQSLKVVMRRLEELFDVKQEVFLEEKNKMTKGIQGDILLDGLTYSYQENVALLKDLHLHIRKKDKVVLYGPSGSGKSTLVKLLFRYYQIPKDVILLDQIGINHYLLEDIRKYITYVSQNEILFTDTIYHNIVLNQEVSYETFLAVCKITKVDEIVFDHVLGYDRMIEENGFNLSGGERQRIILARTLLKSSNIFIFDEAFNQIDVKREREILKDMFVYLQDKTVIVVSHREQNQDLFDRIIQMEGGTCHEMTTTVG